MAERTVKGHRSSIFKKFGVTSAVELTRLADRFGIDFLCNPTMEPTWKVVRNIGLGIHYLEQLYDRSDIRRTDIIRQVVKLLQTFIDENRP